MSRTHRRAAAVLTLVSVAALAFALPASAGGKPFRLTLTGAAEVPGPGDPDGTGTAMFTINRGTGTICWEVTVEDILLPAIAAHIHEVPPDPGPVVVPITAPDANGHSSGCTSVDRELAKEISMNPSSFYFNVHTSDFQPGALRAQLG